MVNRRVSGGHRDGAEQMGRQLRGQIDGGGAVGAADDGDGAGLVRCETDGERHHVCAEDAELGGCADKHQLGIGDQGREVGHGADAEEYQRGIPAGANTVVEDVEHRSLFVDADFETGSRVERHVADKDAEADGHEQHRFEVFLYGEPDEKQTDKQHHKVARFGIGETCQFPELAQVVH